MRRFQPRLLAVILVTMSSSALAADEFQSQAAKDSRARFDKTIKAARAVYITDLESAAKKALIDDKLDEAIRIKETIKNLKSQQNDDQGDPVVQLRRRLENSTWSWNRPGKPAKIRFLPKNRFTATKHSGVWEALEARLLILKVDGAKSLFLFSFDEKLKTYRTIAFGPVKTRFTVGKTIH